MGASGEKAEPVCLQRWLPGKQVTGPRTAAGEGKGALEGGRRDAGRERSPTSAGQRTPTSADEALRSGEKCHSVSGRSGSEQVQLRRGGAQALPLLPRPESGEFLGTGRWPQEKS